jgi:hypothetical protein
VQPNDVRIASQSEVVDAALPGVVDPINVVRVEQSPAELAAQSFAEGSETAQHAIDKAVFVVLAFELAGIGGYSAVNGFPQSRGTDPNFDFFWGAVMGTTVAAGVFVGVSSFLLKRWTDARLRGVAKQDDVQPAETPADTSAEAPDSASQ